MKGKRKPSPRAVLAIVVASVMILTTVCVLLFLLLHLLFTPSYDAPLTPIHVERRGIENWGDGSGFLGSQFTAEGKDNFLLLYEPDDGDYYYDCRVSVFWINSLKRSLAFLTYDDPAVYAAAKQSRLDYAAKKAESGPKPLSETRAFGFAFCSFDDIMKVTKGRGKNKYIDYEAFGYNDETLTLVFLRFDASGSREKRYMKLANTDYEAFLSHYYGEWFDWEAGVGIHLPE